MENQRTPIHTNTKPTLACRFRVGETRLFALLSGLLCDFLGRFLLCCHVALGSHRKRVSQVNDSVVSGQTRAARLMKHVPIATTIAMSLELYI